MIKSYEIIKYDNFDGQLYKNWQTDMENKDGQVKFDDPNEKENESQTEDDSHEEGEHSNDEEAETKPQGEAEEEIFANPVSNKRQRDYEIITDENDYFKFEYTNDMSDFSDLLSKGNQEHHNNVTQDLKENVFKLINYDLFSYDASCICNMI